ncbi:MAG: hypothetical protein K2L98_04490 [Bacilli bacterium]|nr:hypothetical protein [Bacilli bacterium]
MDKIIEELEQFLEKLNAQMKEEVFNRVQNKAAAEVREDMLHRIKLKETAGEGTRGKIAEGLLQELKQDPMKLIKFDDKRKDELTEECYKEMDKEDPSRQRNKDILENIIKYLKADVNQLYLELDKLSEMFQYYNLHVNTQIDIFCHIMRVNHQMDLGPNEKTYLPDPEAMLNYEYEYIDIKDLRKLFKEKHFDAFLGDKSPKYGKAREEVQKRYDETKRDFTSRQLASNILGAIFEKEVVDITEEDYQTIVEKMDELFFGHISHRLIKKFKKQKELELNPPVEKDEKVENNTSKGKKPIVKGETPKKQTSLNQTLREINKYFDLDTFELK